MQPKSLAIPGKRVEMFDSNEKSGFVMAMDKNGRKSFISYPTNEKSWFTLKLDRSPN